MSLAAGARLGPYEVISPLGAGGMGEVYRARDTRLDRDVAIKVLPPAFAADADRRARFEREAKAIAALSHPNILAIHDTGTHDGQMFVVTELLEGQTLGATLRAGALPTRKAIDIGVQIARGLAAAHDKGIVHRDLKPENVFLLHDGQVRILDFGVAKLVRPSGADEPTAADAGTGLGLVVGTIGYMAPEQVRGEPIDHRADIFALGVVVHEMLSGTPPFARDTTPEILTAILKDDAPALPSSVTPVVERVVRRCLEKRREERFHSAHDLGLAFDLLSTMTVTGQTPAAPQPVRAVPRRTALVYGASSLALLASGVAGGMFLDRRLRPTVPPSFRRLTFRRGVIRSARFSPDGQTILYGALWDGDGCRVHTVRVDSPESRPLDLPDANVLAISRSGEVALAVGSHSVGLFTYGTLARVPIAGGPPRHMLPDVKFADWSPDGSDLAIVRRVDGRDRLEFPIGKILVQPPAGVDMGLSFARVSADGRRVAFVQCRAPESLVGRVAIVDQTGTVTPLSREYLNIHGLAWKGDDIWYTAADERPLFRALSAVTPRGTRRTITRMPGNATLWDVSPDGRLLLAHTDDRAVVIAHVPGDVADRDLSWLDSSWVADLSLDGRLLLFTETGQGSGAESSTYLRGTDGSPAVRLGAGRAVALSPDTRWALCLSSVLPSPYLDLLPTGVGEARRIPGDGFTYTGAQWLDGNRIIVSALAPGQQARLYVHELKTGQQHPITPEAVDAWTLSPNGSTIAARGPDPMIRLYPTDGSAPREVAGLSGHEVPVAWINEGLLVTRPGDPASPLGDVYRVDLATGRQELWKNILPRDRAGIFTFLTLRVTPDGRSQAYTWHRSLSNLYVAEGLA